MPSLKPARKLWVWVLLFVIVLFLLSSNLSRKQTWNPLEQAFVEITAPFQKFVNFTLDLTENIWLKYFALVDVHNENIQLKQRLSKLELVNNRYQEVIATNRRLQELLQLRETINFPVKAVQVIGRDPSGWFESIIINKGKRDGLKVNMPVVNAEGVVGRLVSVSPNYSKVLLVIDQNSSVDCLIQRSRDKGIVKGLTSKICKLDYVVKTGEARENDLIITSGLGRVFPKGFPVGRITEVENPPGELFKVIRLKPSVDFSKLEELLVILKEDPLLNNQSEEK